MKGTDRGLTTPADASQAPVRHPCRNFDCEGGYNADQGNRPFKHRSVGRCNWKRSARKRQRRAWKQVPEAE
jgi:hypothetical protein